MANYLRGLFYLQGLMRRLDWDGKRLRDYQNEKLREVIRYAYQNSYFYHKKFDESNVRPEDIKTVDDLSKLPIIRKDELPSKINDLISKPFEIDRLCVQRTSGSTGHPLHIYFTAAENDFRKAKHLRAQIVLGQKSWDRWVTITSPLHFAETTKLQRFLRLFGIDAISVFDDVSLQAEKINKLKPAVLDGYANSILLLAREIQKRGLKDIRLKFLVSGAELIDPHSREFVEEVFNAPFYDQYASVEFERLAWQCSEKDEYHIDMDTSVMQFVDDNGDNVCPGEQGEIICTSLFNHSMPLIRYALDDVGIPSEKTECECGRQFPLMKVLQGRKTSIFKLPGGRILAPFAFMLAVWTFKNYGYIDLFRVVQKRTDLIVFRLKLKENAKNEAEIRKDMEEHVRKTLNLKVQDVAIEVECVDDIPLDKTGKFQIVASELGEAA